MTVSRYPIIYVAHRIAEDGTLYSKAFVRCPVPYTTYAIDGTGAIYDWRGVHMLPTLTKTGYHDSTLVDDIGERHNHGTHRIVCWTFDADFDINDPNMDVHHRDGCTTNNHPSNLVALTKEKHQLETAAANPGRGSKRSNTCSVGVERVCPNTGHVDRYTTIALAMSVANVSQHGMRTLLAAGQDGWRYATKPIKDERWYRLAKQIAAYWRSRGKPDLAKVCVSSMGRVRKGTRATFGTVGAQNRLMWGSTQVSWIVCVCFHGPPPLPGVCVVHRDGNVQNNREDNVTWSSNHTRACPPTCWSQEVEEHAPVALNALEHVFGAVGVEALLSGQTIETPADVVSRDFNDFMHGQTTGMQEHIRGRLFNLECRQESTQVGFKALQKILKYGLDVTLDRCSNSSKRPRYHILKLLVNNKQAFTAKYKELSEE